MIDPTEVWRSLGITDYDTNHKYLQHLMEKGIELADVALLDPDEVDLVKFWRMAPELDANSIAGSDATRYDVRAINDTNQRIIHQSGALHFLRLSPTSRLLEIGAGFGSFYELLPAFMLGQYVGLDVIPRFHPVRQATEGIPAEMSEYKFTHVVTFNAMQHFSLKTKLNYIRDALRLIVDGGKFVLNAAIASSGTAQLKDAHGTGYFYTAGQLVPALIQEQYYDMVQRCAEVVGVKAIHHGNQAQTGICTFLFQISKD